MTGPRKPRKDALANRERLLDTATELLGNRDGDLSVNELAAASGMGVGTAYRHFPDRDALVRALYEREVEALATRVTPRLEGESAWDTLSSLIAASVLSVARNPAQRTIMRLMYDLDPTYKPAEHILDLLAGLVAAAKAEGKLREDVEAGDLVVLVYSLGRLAGDPGEIEQGALLRAVALFFDGLRTDGQRTVLEVPPLDRDELHAITHRSNASAATD